MLLIIRIRSESDLDLSLNVSRSFLCALKISKYFLKSQVGSKICKAVCKSKKSKTINFLILNLDFDICL